jgi:hypothetical protein
VAAVVTASVTATMTATAAVGFSEVATVVSVAVAGSSGAYSVGCFCGGYYGGSR